MANYWGSVLWGLIGWGYGPAIVPDGVLAADIEIESTAEGFIALLGTSTEFVEIESTASGLVGRIGIVDGTIEIDSSASGFAGRLGTIEANVEIESVAYTGGQSSAFVEVEVSGSLSIGSISSASVEVAIDLVASGVIGRQGILSADIEIDSDGDVQYSQQGACASYIEVKLSGSGFIGLAGVIDVEVVIDADADVTYVGRVGTITADVSIETEGYAEITTAVTDSLCVVLNTRTEALSEYTNYAFSSLCKFEEHYLGTKSGGIFELTGDDDSGIDIATTVQWHPIDINSNAASRLHDNGWIVGESDGQLKVTITNDSDVDATSVVSKIDGYREGKVKMPRGFKGRWYEFEITNIKGCSFFIDMYRVLARHLNRLR